MHSSEIREVKHPEMGPFFVELNSVVTNKFLLLFNNNRILGNFLRSGHSVVVSA
jgi:hypothetical protein